MKYSVIKKFRDKYTNQIYEPGHNFESEDVDRVLNLQERGLIGGESPLEDGEKVEKPDAPKRKKGTTDKPK